MIKISFRLKHFERRAIRVKGLNNSKSSYLINTISQRLQQSYAAVLQGLHSKLSKVIQTFHSHVESFEQSQGDLTADKENTFISFK